MNIEKLLALDKSQIKDEKILFVLTDFIGDYQELEEDEKEEFLKLSVDEIKNAGAYYQFLLLFHVAIAVALWSEIPPIPIVDQKANKAEEGKKNK